MSNNLKELFEDLEGHNFATKVNAASSLNLARKIIWDDPTIKKIRGACKQNLQKVNELLDQVKDLAKKSFDLRYESPWDTALTALLLIINEHNPVLGEIAANLILRAPQTWWAKKEAYQIITIRPLSTTASDLQPVNVVLTASDLAPNTNLTMTTPVGRTGIFNSNEMFHLKYSEWVLIQNSDFQVVGTPLTPPVIGSVTHETGWKKMWWGEKIQRVSSSRDLPMETRSLQ